MTTVQTILASVGGLLCFSTVGATAWAGISYLRSAAKANAISPAGQQLPLVPPPKVETSNAIAAPPAGQLLAERTQTVSRSFDAWSVDKQEEMLVVSLMGDGKEQEAIDLLQLRIKRKKSADQATPVTASA